MSTDYSVELTASDGTSATITITHSLNPLPGSDTWVPADQAQFDCAGGAVSSWGQSEADLTGPYGPKSLVLEGFKKSTQKDDKGTGNKSYLEGTFPSGDLTWTCTHVA